MVGPALLPVLGSEDFGEYTKLRPGAFFFLTTLEKPNTPMVHTPHFNFNDNIISLATRVWLELALDRLGAK
jgi:metal-dependent amidase/aminoacylase/carboxypeptidase family protein